MELIPYKIKIAHAIANLLSLIYERNPIKVKAVYVVTLDRELNK